MSPEQRAMGKVARRRRAFERLRDTVRDVVLHSRREGAGFPRTYVTLSIPAARYHEMMDALIEANGALDKEVA